MFLSFNLQYLDFFEHLQKSSAIFGKMWSKSVKMCVWKKRPVKIMNWVFQISCWDVFSRATGDFRRASVWSIHENWPLGMTFQSFFFCFDASKKSLKIASRFYLQVHLETLVTQPLTWFGFFLQLSEVLRDVRECKQRSESMTDPEFKGNKKFRNSSYFLYAAVLFIAFRKSRSISL